jgi:hypothetical protein
VFVAATSGDGGKLFTQATLAEDVSLARAAGKEVGFYHFNGPTDPVAAAEYFWAAIAPYFRSGDLTALDIESSSGGKVAAQSPAWAAAFLTRLAQLRGVSFAASRPGIYGNRTDMRAAGYGSLERAGAWLWLAAPGGYPENTPIGEWSCWTILQFSSDGGIDRDESQSTFAQIAGTTKPIQEDDMPRYIRNSDNGTIAIGTVGVFHVELPGPAYVTLLDGWKVWDRTLDMNLPDNVYQFVKSMSAHPAVDVAALTAALAAHLPTGSVTISDDQLQQIVTAAKSGAADAVKALSFVTVAK